MNTITLQAYAKINLGLDVVKRREDGYHEVRMVMQTVKLSDRITIRKTTSSDITIKTNLSYLPTNENNLVYKASKLLKDEFNISDGIHIQLQKHIPVAAGLAGGSSDAAATLVGLNRLFHLGLSKKELMKRGVLLGADIPYCILRGTALSEGIGEILTPLPPMPKCHVLIAKPDIYVSTKFVYEHLNLNQLASHPNIDGITTAICQNDLIGVANRLENVLESVTIKEYPIIEEIKQVMLRHGALNSLMSGSGPTVFGLFTNIDLAKAAYEELNSQHLAKQLFITEFFNQKGSATK